MLHNMDPVGSVGNGQEGFEFEWHTLEGLCLFHDLTEQAVRGLSLQLSKVLDLF